MINNKKVLAIIPARGGSKGLPGKNIRPICGKPLIEWTIAKAQKSEFIDEIMVSTDSQQIADIAVAAGANVPELRPAHLATDTATSFDAVKHVIEFYKQQQNADFDYIVLLEPTSPLREDQDIDRMLSMLDAHGATHDSIVSMGEVNEHPSIMKRFDRGELSPFCPELQQTSRRQDNTPAYFPYGVAYIVKTKTLLEEKSFYSQRCLGFPIKRYQCYEIDDIYDFLCIESIMKYEWKLL